jgi:multidrug efflux pump subunit AcrB
MISNMGVYNGMQAAFTTNAGSQDAFMIIELTEDRKNTSQYYAKLLRERIPKELPDVELGIQLGGLLSSAVNSGQKAPLDIQFFGPEVAESMKNAKELLPQLKKIPGAVDVRIQERFDAPQINVEIDRIKSDEKGLNIDEIIENLVSSVSGSVSFQPDIWVDPGTGIDYFLGVRFAEDSMKSMKDFMSIPITGRHQLRPVSLRDIASVSHSQDGITELNRVNMNRIVNIYMDAEGRDIGSLASDVQKILEKYPFQEGYSTQVQGEVSEMNSALTSLFWGILLAVVMIYMVLVVQFRSFIYPGIMMMTVPTGLVGIILMFILTHTYFSIQAAIGTIFMIGIAVSNGVLLVEFMQHRLTQNLESVDQAILEAASTRLRPILMTSLASILGLVPMALGMGKGSEANIPLGRAVIGGQLVSTVLTLFVVPTLFRLVYLRVNKNKSSKPLSLSG